MNIAWGYLSDEQRAQLLHCRPDLQDEYRKEHLGWRRCSLCPALVPAQDIQNGLCSLCRMLLEKVKEE